MKLIRNCCFAIAFVLFMATAANVAGAGPRNARVTVPVMTRLSVKLDEAVNLKAANNGAGFTATFTQPVEVDGMTVIPAGASAAGLIDKEAQSSLVLNSVFVNGRSYRVTTSPVAIGRKTSLAAGSAFTFNLTLSVSVAR